MGMTYIFKFLSTIMLVVLLFLAFPAHASQVSTTGTANDTVAMIEITPERLPDMNIPRFSHSVFYANGELTVTGGHTSGFVLTPTAEYFKDGEWHLMQMVYNHDDGIFVPLRSGKVLLAGGYEKNLGIGQTFEVEMYDPATHSFEGFGCLDKKRVHSVGVEMNDGKVVISGNWFNEDAIAVYDSGMYFNTVKEVSVPRSAPLLLKTSDGDVMVVSGFHDNYGKDIEDRVVDRLKGSSFHVPLLDSLQSICYHRLPNSNDFFIGNEEKGEYGYLFPVISKAGQVSIVEVRDTVFSLLPTDKAIPMRDGNWDIDWYTMIAVDRNTQRAYMMGHILDGSHRKYLLCIDYGKDPAELTCFYTDSIHGANGPVPMVTPEGNVITVGGFDTNNFTPSAAVWLFPVGDSATILAESKSNISWWWILAVALIAGALLAYIIIKKARKTIVEMPTPQDDSQETATSTKTTPEMMQRIENMMEEKKLYLNSDLRMQDVAKKLGIHQNDVSACINSNKGYSFSQFVNNYRVEYAKQLMLDNPSIKMAQVALESGFSSDTSFYRTFKTLTGMSPSEWLSKANG